MRYVLDMNLKKNLCSMLPGLAQGDVLWASFKQLRGVRV